MHLNYNLITLLVWIFWPVSVLRRLHLGVAFFEFVLAQSANRDRLIPTVILRYEFTLRNTQTEKEIRCKLNRACIAMHVSCESNYVLQMFE